MPHESLWTILGGRGGSVKRKMVQSKPSGNTATYHEGGGDILWNNMLLLCYQKNVNLFAAQAGSLLSSQLDTSA